MHFARTPKGCSILVVVTAACMLVGFAGSASAAPPACTTTTPFPDLTFSELGHTGKTNQVPVGAVVNAPFSAIGSAIANTPVTVAFVPVAGGTLTYPITMQLANTGGSGVIPVQFAPGDSGGLLVATTGESSSSEGICILTTTSQPIYPASPSTLIGKARPDWWEDNTHLDSVLFGYKKDVCGTGTLSFGVGYKGNWFWRDSQLGCELGQFRNLSALGWVNIASRADYLENNPYIEVTSLKKRRFSRKLDYAFKFGGIEVKRGSFIVKRTHIPRSKGVKVFDTNFDDYVNICIDGDYNIHAQGGHLYCYLPQTKGYWQTTVKSIKQ